MTVLMTDAKLEFSKLLYVRVESDETFTAHDEMYPLAEMGETSRIATYQLLTVDDVKLILETRARHSLSRLSRPRGFHVR